jgi:hypothetical protein
MPSILNSDDGVVSGTSGLKTTGGNDGVTVFQQNGTEAARISAASNVGIGTTNAGAFRLAVVGSRIQLSGGSTSQEGIAIQRIAGAATITGINNDNNAYNDVALYAGASEGARLTTGGLFQFNSGYGSVATAYGCRSWVNFNGTGTVAIRASGNVSSITDNGTGNYTVNFTTAFVDTSYSGVFGCNDNGNTSTMCYRTGGTKSTTAFQVSTASGVAVLADNDMCMVAVFR